MKTIHVPVETPPNRKEIREGTMGRGAEIILK